MQPLSDIFNERSFFRIPVYQRGYSWEFSQLEAFWNDIDNLMNNSHNHYMGMIGVERLNENLKKKNYEKWENYNSDLYPLENHHFFHIVDGQQRLTTIIILLSQILFFMDENHRSWFNAQKRDIIRRYKFSYPQEDAPPFYYLGYEADQMSNECLVRNIFNDEDYSVQTNKYTSNMIAAKEFFREKISELKKRSDFQKELNKIYVILTARLQFDFNQFKSEEISMIFETMNDRGKPLSNLEKLKNRLIYLTGLLRDKDSIQESLILEIDKTWAEIFQYLGKFEKYISEQDDIFLKNHWIMYKRYDRKEAEFYKKDIFETFAVKSVLENSTGTGEIVDYVRSLNQGIAKWFFINNPKHESHRISNKAIVSMLNKLRYIGFKSFSPIIMTALIRKESEEKLLNLLSAIEKHIFLLFYFSFKRADTGSYNFYSRASQYYRNDTTVESITKEIHLDWTYGLNPEKNPVNSYIDPTGFYSYMREFFVREKRYGYYSWLGKIGIKYFLMEYELSINPDLDSSIIDYGNYYLELVFPGAVLKDEEDTDSNENSDTFEDMSDVEEVDAEYMELLKDKRNNITKEDSEYRLKKLKYTLGNIVLVKKPFTASERKMPFEEKRKYSFMSRSMLENEREVFSSSSWLPIDILNRGLKLLEFMESRWQFQFKYWNMDKRKILFLDFIDPNQ